MLLIDTGLIGSFSSGWRRVLPASASSFPLPQPAIESSPAGISPTDPAPITSATFPANRPLIFFSRANSVTASYIITGEEPIS
jgi:hypothetical protein